MFCIDWNDPEIPIIIKGDEVNDNYQRFEAVVQKNVFGAVPFSLSILQDAHVAVMSPHTSFVDPSVLKDIGMKTFVSRAENEKVPLVGGQL